jgi:basic amino acid/polyamine antiporter, APA family
VERAEIGENPKSGDATITQDGAETGLFVRKSSGLVREMGIRDAFSINIAGVNPTGIGFFFFVILAGFAGTDLSWPIVVALVGALLLSAVYSQLTAMMPRSGADFIYVSRLFHPALGGAVGLAYFLAIIIGVGVNVTALANTYIPFIFQTLGNVFGSPGLTTFAEHLAEKTPSIIVSILILLVVAGIMTRHVGAVARATFWAFAAGLVGVVVLIIEFLFHGPGSFQASFDHLASNPHAYNQMIDAARHSGAELGVKWSQVWASLALVFALYGGATFANFTGGELRRPGSTYRISTFACLGLAFVLTLAAWLTLRHTVGFHFLQASVALSGSNGPLYEHLAHGVTLYVPSYALVIAGDPVSKIVIAIGFAAGVLSLIIATVLIMSRLLFAMAFDRLIPTAVADVRPKSHVPLAAIAVVVLLSLATAILAIQTTLLTATRNSSLILTAVFAISSLAAALAPWLRRDLYDRSPKMVGNKILGVPAVTLIGVASCAYWLFATYMGATKAQVSGGYSTSSVIVLIVMCAAGAVFYLVSRLNLRRKGLDLGLAMHELPPE